MNERWWMMRAEQKNMIMKCGNCFQLNKKKNCMKMEQSNFIWNVFVDRIQRMGNSKFSVCLRHFLITKKRFKRFFFVQPSGELCIFKVVCSVFGSSLVTFGRICCIVRTKSNVIIAKKDKTQEILLDFLFVQKRRKETRAHMSILSYFPLSVILLDWKRKKNTEYNGQIA